MSRYSRDRLELRGQFAHMAIGNAGELNDALGRAVGVDPNVASALRGFYGEAGYRVISGASFGDIGVFARYENFDTQFRMPDGYLPLKAFDRDALVFGATYWPDPDIAVKVDYGVLRNQSPVIARAQLVQHRSGMVVLMTRTFTHCRSASGAVVCALAASARPDASAGAADEAAGRRHRRGALQLHAVGVSRESRRARWRFVCAATTRTTDSGFSGPTSTSIIPKRGKGAATITFQPPKPGRYIFECSKLCGAGHAFMRGTLIAE